MATKNMEQTYLAHTYLTGSNTEKAFLAHHGILGMKWGIRRFQNKDGTRTEAGKKRESIDPDVMKSAKTLISLREEIDKLTYNEYKASFDKYWKERNEALEYIIDHDNYISKKLKEANDLASEFDDQDNPNTHRDLTNKETERITKLVNKIVDEDCRDRYRELIKQAGGSDIDADNYWELANENFWLRVHNFGY